MSNINLKDILGKDPKKCTSEEIAAAKEQLQAILNSADVEQDRAQRREARRALNQKRAAYQLTKPTHRAEIQKQRVLDALDAHFLETDVLTSTQYRVILRENTFRVPNDFKDIYPCPECGAVGSLYVGRFDNNLRRVVCSCCDWECPRTSRHADYEAKDAFILYLHKQGYLGEKKPKLEDVK